MADINLIFPRELVAAATVAASDVIPVDNGTVVQKATPVQIVNAGRPFATQGQAETGTDATVAMSPLTTRQAINALAPAIIQPFVDLAEAWAESPTPPDPGVPTSKSSKTWAGESQASATAASGFAGAASSSASDAQDSADAAANSAASLLGLPLVRYDAQTLTGPQRDQVKANLEAVSYAVQTLTGPQKDQVKINLEAVGYAAQTLTSTQKEQVLSNIAANVLSAGAGWDYRGNDTYSINTTYTNSTGYPMLWIVGNQVTDGLFRVMVGGSEVYVKTGSGFFREVIYVPAGATFRAEQVSGAITTFQAQRYAKA